MFELLREVDTALDAVPLDAYAGLAPAEQVSACELLARLEARVQAHRLAAARAAEKSNAARSTGATSTGAMLAHQFGGDQRAAARMLKQAKKLEKTSATQDALAQGKVSLGQAELIADTVAGLPGDPSEEERQACEEQLICDAQRLSLKDLSRRADRISETYAPDDADRFENEKIEDREKKARKNSYFWMADRGDGTVKGDFVIDEAHGAMLKHALEAINAPQVRSAGETAADAVLDEPRTHGQQMADAFCILIESLQADRLPHTAGTGATMTVNIDLDVLLGKIAAATLSDGTRISAGQARRMACELNLLPQVFNGESLPLDHGRRKRCFDTNQRRALEPRDRGCTFPGCDRPPTWCVVHHARERWADGGTTDLDDGVMICPAHHRIVHDDHWEIVFAPDGVPEYRPPGGQLRRNQRFRADGAA